MAKRRSKRQRDEADGILPIVEATGRIAHKGGIVAAESADPPGPADPPPAVVDPPDTTMGGSEASSAAEDPSEGIAGVPANPPRRRSGNQRCDSSFWSPIAGGADAVLAVLNRAAARNEASEGDGGGPETVTVNGATHINYLTTRRR